MPVVKRHHQADVLRQQHAIAKHVTRHVTNTGNCEAAGLGIDRQAAEMPLDRFPGTARGNAHLLVVITDRSSGGKGVAEPEAVIRRHAVGNVGKGGCAFVCCHHQIRVVLVMAHYVYRRHHNTFDHVVGDVQQPGQKQLVASHTFGQVGVPFRSWRCILEHEAALGADRHDHRVFDLLRLDQAQNFGAEIFPPVRPAQPAARHLASAQVHPFDTRGIDPYLEQRFGLGHTRHLARLELQRQIGLVPANCGFLPQVGACGCGDGSEELAQYPVVIQAGNICKTGFDALAQALLRRLPILSQARIETGIEEGHDGLGNRCVPVQGSFNVGLAEGEAELLEVTGVGAQHADGPRIEIGGEHQFVQVVAFHVATPGQRKQRLESLLDTRQLGICTHLQAHVVNPQGVAANPVGVLVQHPRSQPFEHGQ